MTPTHRRAAGLAAGLFLAVSCTGEALAWGHTGHVGISTLAILNLPADLPAFLRTPAAAQQVGELGAEADVSKGTGTVVSINPTSGFINFSPSVHDAERDPGHYLDFDDNGNTYGGAIPLTNLFTIAPTREAYDTKERGVAQTQYSAGYLPYNIVDGWQQLRKDFGIWRALSAGLSTATAPSDVAYFRYQLQLRQTLILRDLGHWSHFVADGSQPMHVSIHFNGWDPSKPANTTDPATGYTNARIHAPFEGSFVRNFIDFSTLGIRPYTNRNANTIEGRVQAYMAETLMRLLPAYEADKNSGYDHYATNQPLEQAMVKTAIEAGVAELRDEIVDAWNQSLNIAIGFPYVTVADAVSGKVKITPMTLGSD